MIVPRNRARTGFAALLALTLLVPASPAQDTEEDTSLTISAEAGFTDNSGSLVARNNVNRPVFVVLTVDGGEYITRRSPASDPVRARVPAGATSHQLVTYEYQDNLAEFTPGYSYEAFMADPQANHDDQHLYVFPWAHGERRRIGQPYGGRLSHQSGTQSQYALDFDMDVGTAVHAARGGLVVEVVENKRGQSPVSEGDPGNHVYILHDDDTLGSYAHLRRNGVDVSVGDTVTAGQLLGYSGNTGSSSGPHLHFQVSRGGGESFPTRFRLPDGSGQRGQDLSAGDHVVSAHPGQAPPQQTADAGEGSSQSGGDSSALGQGSSSGDDGGCREVRRDNNVSFETEDIDNGVRLFLRNGTNQELRVRVRLVLQNATSDQGNDFTVTAPARRSCPVARITQDDMMEGWNYRALRPQIQR